MSRGGKLTERVGDAAIAEALRIAERRLIALGWRYSVEDVGKTAAQIIAALDNPAGRSALEGTRP
jgi:hypothetical protein